MSVMIQIRNVPSALHRRLKSRAALAGMSLSDYLLNIAKSAAEQPTIDEMIERLRRLPKVSTSIDSADIIRAERDKP